MRAAARAQWADSAPADGRGGGTAAAHRHDRSGGGNRLPTQRRRFACLALCFETRARRSFVPFGSVALMLMTTLSNDLRPDSVFSGRCASRVDVFGGCGIVPFGPPESTPLVCHVLVFADGSARPAAAGAPALRWRRSCQSQRQITNCHRFAECPARDG